MIVNWRYFFKKSFRFIWLFFFYTTFLQIFWIPLSFIVILVIAANDPYVIWFDFKQFFLNYWHPPSFRYPWVPILFENEVSEILKHIDTNYLIRTTYRYIKKFHDFVIWISTRWWPWLRFQQFACLL